MRASRVAEQLGGEFPLRDLRHRLEVREVWRNAHHHFHGRQECDRRRLIYAARAFRVRLCGTF